MKIRVTRTQVGFLLLALLFSYLYDVVATGFVSMTQVGDAVAVAVIGAIFAVIGWMLAGRYRSINEVTLKDVVKALEKQAIAIDNLARAIREDRESRKKET